MRGVGLGEKCLGRYANHGPKAPEPPNAYGGADCDEHNQCQSFSICHHPHLMKKPAGRTMRAEGNHLATLVGRAFQAENRPIRNQLIRAAPQAKSRHPDASFRRLRSARGRCHLRGGVTVAGLYCSAPESVSYFNGKGSFGLRKSGCCQSGSSFSMPPSTTNNIAT